MVTSPPLIESALPTIGTTPRPTPQGVSYAAMTLDAWLKRFEQDVLQFESLEAFAQVKVAEALAFCEKMELHIEQQAQLEAEAAVERACCLDSSTSHRSLKQAPRQARVVRRRWRHR
ncbi:hypothetical protein PINS_up016750 [Pythium insidiosum]|nr:hypothetical protein PINS_up016750 [Pythium insidiosum]